MANVYITTFHQAIRLLYIDCGILRDISMEEGYIEVYVFAFEIFSSNLCEEGSHAAEICYCRIELLSRPITCLAVAADYLAGSIALDIPFYIGFYIKYLLAR